MSADIKLSCKAIRFTKRTTMASLESQSLFAIRSMCYTEATTRHTICRTFPLVQNPGRMMSSKLRTYLRPKCHPLLLDGNINSPATVRLNVYQVHLPDIHRC